jgi:uncharacterized protein YjbJ (UPF0337 family)
MTNNPAAEARDGLLGTVAGKAKEVAGALTGNDGLVEEGQLQHAEAERRKEAVADEAIADAERQEAAQELRTANVAANLDERAAQADAERRERLAEDQRAGQHAHAEQQAAREETAGRQAAEELGDAVAETRIREAETLEESATTTEQRAATEAVRLQREADAAAKKADELRAHTEK